MPCGDGRISSNPRKLVDRGGCPLSRRYLDQKNYNIFSKEHQGSKSVLRNSEQRCVIITFVTLEHDAWKFLAPISLLTQGSDLRNHLDSEVRVNGDGIESLSPPLAIVFPVDLPKDKANSSEHSGSANSCSSYGANFLGQSRNRSKWNKSVKSFSNMSLPNSVALNNVSGSDCDGSNLVSSDVLANNIPKKDKPVKRASRKKGKKKGKQYKKSVNKKNLPVLEYQGDENISDASASGTSISSGTASTSELIPQNNMSEKVALRGSSVQDITMEQDDNEANSSDSINGLETPFRHSSYGPEIDEYEPIASFTQRSATEEASCIQLGMYEGSNHLPVKSSSTKSPEVIRSAAGVNTTNAHPYQNDSHCDSSCSISLNKDKAPMADSSVDNWKLEASENCSNDGESWSSIKDKKVTDPSKSRIVLDDRNNDTLFCSIIGDSWDNSSDMSGNCYSGNHSTVEDVGDTDNSTERAQCSSHASSSNDFQPVINRKRNRLTKKLSQSLNGIHRFGAANMNDLVGKDNNYSFWQRVQKNDTEEFICEPKKINLAPHVEISPRCTQVKGKVNQPAQIEFIKASSDDVDSSKLLPKATDGRYNIPARLKWKSNSSSKQGNHYPMKLSHSDKTNMDRPSKIHVQQSRLEISPRVTHQQFISIGSRSSCSNGFPKTQINVEQGTPAGNIHSMECNMQSNVADNSTSLSVMISNSLDHTQIKVHSDSGKDVHEHIPLSTESKDCRYMKSESENSHTDSNKLDMISTPVSHKWLPVGRKESSPFNMSPTDNLRVSFGQDSALNSLKSKNGKVEFLSHNSYHSLQMNCGAPCLVPFSEDTVYPSRKADELNIYHPQAYGEYGGVVPAPNRCLSHDVKDQCLISFETDLEKIVQAVDDSCKLQTASEGVHVVTGSPVAEFERFLHSASPILNQICCIKSCETCSPNQLIGGSLCRHQFPNLPLRYLWQWYEKPGSYGMEVKVEDYYSSTRSCNGRHEFRAYFVPYISAIQLFGWFSSSVCANNGYLSEEAADTCEVDGICNQSVRNKHLGNGELLFEYFESDQPQQRRPLFEKIKELVRGDTSSNCSVFGDPLKLECLNLHDLHPASWYSVAWYPIYRIPDGNFRAAFLTYHSLGHFVHTSSTPGGAAHLVFPVVGLQSYNAKGECWFQPNDLKSQLAQTEALSKDPSEILKERLRTLEQTASVMARASVCKGNLRSVNRQSDYEFFVSRRR